ncbi:hypothetical protein SAMN04487787_106129 [Kosakonia sacchari]|nr:hypothetical protein SAMN04487787_106129 [Kosakonia sacchari]
MCVFTALWQMAEFVAGKGIVIERYEKEVISREELALKQQGWREIARSRSLSKQPAENTLTHQALTV